jgi:methylmalonyl-CoA mutase N-terminal domain/subunit
VSLTAQQPYNNVVRTAIQALAAVLGGANSLHTNALDEALALPTGDAALLALRTQQVIAHETDVTSTVDPFGGAEVVEHLTQEMETGALDYFRRIDDLGGMVSAIEQGYPQREVADSAYRDQQAVEAGESVIIGVNRYAGSGAGDSVIPTLYIDESVGERQVSRLEELRDHRDATRVAETLDGLRQGAAGTANLMPYLLAAVRAYATVGEMCDALRDVWGEYEETPAL